jgi:hypothetical protein
MTTVDEARDALLAKVTSDWDIDPWGEHEAAKKRLASDLDALIAAVRAEREGLAERASRALLYKTALTDDGFCEECDTATSRKDHDEDCPWMVLLAVAALATPPTPEPDR